MDKVRKIVTGKIQVKATLAIVMVVALLLGLFAYYIASAQRDVMEKTLLNKGQIIALSGAQATADIFERAIKNGEITEKALFDTNYKPIPGTNPTKYHTAFDAFTDSALQRVEDGYLKDEDVVFAAVVDKNGYLPTHNTKYASGAAEAKLNRTKRLFNDPVGLKAAQNTKDLLIQTYKRDTGEIMWDVSTPIYVNGKHWGAFRVGFSMDKVYAKITENNMDIAKAMFGFVFLAVVMLIGLASWLISRTIVQPIKKMVATASNIASVDLENFAEEMRAISEGDLTVCHNKSCFQVSSFTVDHSSCDEIGELAQSFNQMIVKLREIGITFAEMLERIRNLVTEISNSAKELKSSSDVLKDAANQTAQVTSQISTTIEQVAQGASSQSTSIDGILGAVNQLSSIANQVAVSSDSAAALASGTRSTARDGASAVSKTVSGMDAIKEKVGESAQKISQLGEYSAQIGNIVEVITDIADQTNLLALNAAIEAARAGEHGRGFAVVADEVRKLAERATAATGEVAQLITAVQEGTDEAVSAMESGAHEVETGSSLAYEAGESLGKILGAVEDTDKMIVGIAGSIQRMAVKGDEIVSSVEAIAAVVAENSASSEEVSAATQEMSAQIEEVVAAVNQLSDMATHLSEEVKYFKIA